MESLYKKTIASTKNLRNKIVGFFSKRNDLSPETIEESPDESKYKKPSYVSLNEFLDCFKLPISLLQTEIGITEAVRLVQEEALANGAMYLEIRFAPQFHCKKGLTQQEAIQAAINGLEKSKLHTNLILCIMRGDKNKEQNYETIELARKFLVPDNGVVAMDLAGAENNFPTKNYEKEFEKIKSYGIPFTIHAGEADGVSSMRSAINFGAVRLGHGVNGKNDEELLNEIKEKNIGIEICPTSNSYIVIKNMKQDYPLLKYLKKGLKVTINTDDLGICRTNIRQEFEKIVEWFPLERKDIDTLINNSIDIAFTSDETKEELRKKYKEDKFDIIPKHSLIDLHCHLDGSITLPIAKQLADIQDMELPTDDDQKLLKLLSVNIPKIS